MAWARLETSFPRNSKFLALKAAGRMGRDALLLHVEVLCYCREQLTDGNISRSAARTLSFGFPRAAALIELLVQHRLWDEAGDGWRVHDYGEYNPPAAEIRAGLKADAERKRRARRNGVRPDIGANVRLDVQADGRSESARSSPKSVVRSPELPVVASQRAPALSGAHASSASAKDRSSEPTPASRTKATALVAPARPLDAVVQQGEHREHESVTVASAAKGPFQARFIEEHCRLYRQEFGVKPTDEKARYVIVANLRKARARANGADDKAAEREMLDVLRHAFAKPTDFMREQRAFSVNVICSANVYDSLLASMNGRIASANSDKPSPMLAGVARFSERASHDA